MFAIEKVKSMRKKVIDLCVWLKYHYWAFRKGFSLRFFNNTVALKKRDKKILFPRNQMYFFWEALGHFNEYFDSFETERIDGRTVLDFSQTRDQVIKFLGVPLLVHGTTEGEWILKGYTKKYLPQPGDVVFDCGAYCGMCTYYFSKLVGPTGKVYAFEPDEDNYQIVLKNIERHRLDNVTLVKKGLYAHSTTLQFNNRGSGLSKLAGDQTHLVNVSLIEVVSLADAYAQFNLTHLDFVKMDIEGAELEVIEGAKEFLKDKNVHFAIASYHYRNGEQTYKTLEKIFTEIGYKSETGFPRQLTTWASK